MKPNSGTLVIDISGEKAEAYEGVYQCIARNEHGSAMSNNIVIRQSSKADTSNLNKLPQECFVNVFAVTTCQFIFF